MIISSQKASQIVSNHAVLKAVPELLAAVETYKTAERLWDIKKATPNCKSCKRADIFAQAELAAIKAISSLTKEQAQKLAVFLNTSELYIYEPVPGQKPRLKQLGV